MATKLKNLEVNKVDFVDEGANPGAHICLFKRKDSRGGIPSENSSGNSGSMLKKLIGFIGKAAGMGQDEINSAVDEIQKGGSVSFNERLDEAKNRKVADEIWDLCYALQASLCSILYDNELDSTGAETAMKESLGEFHAAVQESVPQWASGKTASIMVMNGEMPETGIGIMKAAVERLNKAIKKAGRNTGTEGKSKENGQDNNENQEGEEKEMKIDKSKLTDAEKAFLESIEKRCGTGRNESQAETETGGQGEAGSQVNKSAQQEGMEGNGGQPQEEAGSIYKGLHPAVAAELAELQKFKQAAEEKELSEVAKKYAIIGKKEEELVPLFKSLKAAGGTAYDDMVAVLDQAVETVEKSGAFSEIGKSGHEGGENSAEAKISNIAKSYMEKNPDLDYHSAIAKAWENNPGLLAEYDEQEGF